jgi:hypothetical protein
LAIVPARREGSPCVLSRARGPVSRRREGTIGQCGGAFAVAWRLAQRGWRSDMDRTSCSSPSVALTPRDRVSVSDGNAQCGLIHPGPWSPNLCDLLQSWPACSKVTRDWVKWMAWAVHAGGRARSRSEAADIFLTNRRAPVPVLQELAARPVGGSCATLTREWRRRPLASLKWTRENGVPARGRAGTRVDCAAGGNTARDRRL